MIEVTEKTSRLLTRLIADKRAHYWNLYNPETNKVLYKIDIDPTKPIGANVWGCCDLSGVDWQHNFSRLERLRYYFALGYILRTTDGSIDFDGNRMNEDTTIQINTQPPLVIPDVIGCFSHRDLCFKATKYLRNKGIEPFHKSQYVVCELERVGESPDAFGFGGSSTQLIEVKVSRSDFLSDKKKYWRKFPEYGLGRFRSYLCPEGLIKETDLPKYWGLLWINEKGKITEIVKPEAQPCNHIEELNLVVSILRRENITPRIFSYKKYASDTVS